MRATLLAVAALSLVACSSDQDGVGPERGGPTDGGRQPVDDVARGGDDTDPADPHDDTGTPLPSVDVSIPDTAVGADTTDTAPDVPDRVEEGCTEVNAIGDPVLAPVDIVWVIDTSGSMNEERDLVEGQLNDFVVFIEESGLDVRVVMIGDDSVCVPEPLSGGACPDTDSPRYRHVRRTVGSHDAFEHIVDAYPEYQDFLRPEAVHHFVVVSDDESDMTARWFYDQVDDLGLSRWVFHAIVSLIADSCAIPGVPFTCEGCSGPHGDAEAKGDKYMIAADMTDGTSHSICASDWTPTFEAIAENVVSGATLPCQYMIPDLGSGLEIVYERVDVTINGVALTHHDTPDGCASAPGWYYDDPAAPTQVILCPAFCGAGFEGDELEIQFGCVKA